MQTNTTSKIIRIDNSSPDTYVTIQLTKNTITFALINDDTLFVDHITADYRTYCNINDYADFFKIHPHVRAALNIKSCINVNPATDSTCNDDCPTCIQIKQLI